jgi:hypothetical protein
MMLKNRCIRKSLCNFITDLFDNPPPDTGWEEWNTYSENQLRQYRGGNFSPANPYIYIVDSNLAPTQTELPMIIIETSTITRPFQLGDTNGRLSTANLHVFGKNRGQRDDIASMLQDVFAKNMTTTGSVVPFPVYDFQDAGASTLVEIAHIHPGVTVETQTVGGLEQHESSLTNWNIVSFSFETKL